MCASIYLDKNTIEMDILIFLCISISSEKRFKILFLKINAD